MKIIKSQNDDTKIAIEQLAESTKDLTSLQTQLDVCENLAKAQAEQINMLNKRANALFRARIAGICIAGTGAAMCGIGLLITKFDASHADIGRILTYTGIGVGSSGIISIVFTIPF